MPRGPSAGPIVINSAHPSQSRFKHDSSSQDSPSTAASQARATASLASLTAPQGRQPRNGSLSISAKTALLKEQREKLLQEKERRDKELRETDGRRGQENGAGGRTKMNGPPAASEKSVADTLAWVRAKSAERRGRKLLNSLSEKENEATNILHDTNLSVLPTSHRSAVASAIQSGDAVGDSIARGVQILADAEKHMNLFESYVSEMKGKVVVPPPASLEEAEAAVASLSSHRKSVPPPPISRASDSYLFTEAEKRCEEARNEAEEKLQKQRDKNRRRRKEKERGGAGEGADSADTANGDNEDKDNNGNGDKYASDTKPRVKRNSGLVYQKLSTCPVDDAGLQGLRARLEGITTRDKNDSGVPTEFDTEVKDASEKDGRKEVVTTKKEVSERVDSNADISYSEYHAHENEDKRNHLLKPLPQPNSPSPPSSPSPGSTNAVRYGKSNVKIVSGRRSPEVDEDEVKAYELMKQIKQDSRLRALRQGEKGAPLNKICPQVGKTPLKEARDTETDIDMEILIREGAEAEARAREKEERRRGGTMQKKMMQKKASAADNNSSQAESTNVLASFDPDSLSGVRLHARDKQRMKEKIDEEEAEAQRLRLFKAMPLPGGGFVQNNLYAKTKAAEGKDVRIRGPAGKRKGKRLEVQSAGRTRGQVRMEASDLFMRQEQLQHQQQEQHRQQQQQQHHNQEQPMQTSLSESELQRKREERKRARREKKLEKEAQETMTLQQEINLLEEKLGKKKVARASSAGTAINISPVDEARKRMAPKHNPEDGRQNEDDDGAFDSYLDAIDGSGKLLLGKGGRGDRQDDNDDDSDTSSSNGGEGVVGDDELLAARSKGAKREVVEVKEEENDSDSINSSDISLTDSDDDDDDDDDDKKSPDDSNKPVNLTISTSLTENGANAGPGSAVYRRQSDWIKKRDMKRAHLLKEKEDKKMEGFTGRPQISHAKESWERAKAAHRSAARREKEAEEARELEKRAKEEAEERKRLRELGGLKAQIRIKRKMRTQSIDKEKQKAALEKLAKPRNGKSVAQGLGIKDEQDLEVYRAKQKLREAGGCDEDEVDEGGDDGFGDMDEKQYIKVMKALGLDPGVTGRKKKSNKGTKSRPSDKVREYVPPKGSDVSTAKDDSLLGLYENETSSSSPQKKDPPSPARATEHSPIMAPALQNGKKRDWRKADFVNDTSVMREIDDVFKELETDKWQPKEGEDEEEDDADFFVGEENGEEDDEEETEDVEFTEEDKKSLETELFQLEQQKKETRNWSFSGHQNQEGIMAHASSALEAAEFALGGLMSRPTTGAEGLGPGERDAAESQNVADLFDGAIEVAVEPYEKYERGECNFFDRSSSAEKGRFRVRDARNFAPESMRRKEDLGSEERGVMLLVGKRGGENTPDVAEQAITILFDRMVFDEEKAEAWWKKNRHRFLGGGEWDAGGGERGF